MTLSRRRLLWLTAAAAGGLAGCSASSGERMESPTCDPVNETPTESSDGETASIEPLVEGQTAFGLELLAHRARRRPNANQFLSPYSVEIALTMTYAGAAGQTRTEMAETLDFRPRDRSPYPPMARSMSLRATGGQGTASDGPG